MKQISFNVNRSPHYIKIQYFKNFILILIITRVKQKSNVVSFKFWNEISKQNLDVITTTYRMFSKFKKINYRENNVKQLENLDCFLYNRENFNNFMIRFREDFSIINDELIDLISIRNLLKILDDLSTQLKKVKQSMIISQVKQSIPFEIQQDQDIFRLRFVQRRIIIDFFFNQFMKDFSFNSRNEFSRSHRDEKAIRHASYNSQRYKERQSSLKESRYDNSFNNHFSIKEKSSSLRRIHISMKWFKYHNDVIWRDDLKMKINRRRRDEMFSSSSRTQSKMNFFYFRERVIYELKHHLSRYSRKLIAIIDYRFYSRNDKMNFVSKAKKQLKFFFNRFWFASYNRDQKRNYFRRNDRGQSHIYENLENVDSNYKRDYERDRELNRVDCNNRLYNDKSFNNRKKSWIEQQSRERSLKSQNVMIWDFVEHFVKFFIRRFQQITNIEETRAMLKILFMCLKTNAFEWHNDFFVVMRAKLNENLIVWKDELIREFRFNKFEFLKKTKKMIFRFDDKEQNLNQYLIRKINLLHDASMLNENIIMRHLWEGLEIQLTLVTSLREDEDITKAFEKRIRNNEQIAQRVWKFNKKIIVRFAIQIIDAHVQSTQYNRDIIFFVSSIARIDRLINNYQKAINQIVVSIVIVTSTIIFKLQSNRKPLTSIDDNIKFLREKKRPCRHCEEKHWNYECDQKDTLLIEEKNCQNNQSKTMKFDEKNMKTLKVLYVMKQKQKEKNQNRWLMIATQWKISLLILNQHNKIITSKIILMIMTINLLHFSISMLFLWEKHSLM